MTATPTTYRPVPLGEALCRGCEKPFQLIELRTAPSFTNRHGVRQKPRVIPVHGPRNNRCTGSHGDPMPWLEATRLPGWDNLTDRDKGAALMHVWKCHWERDPFYARNHYPADYFDHPLLVDLDHKVASLHAVVVAGTWKQAMERLGEDEAQRLYDLALDADRAARGVR
ncbi:hypothetical protein BJF79_39690 [Actinomadura sp. CNU-125]|uniref:hypothetical protein n=1 Tax=Actinomadura sp. CNU-125 TaxID=1904961 RepID=UPI00095CE215|nr:hypothetical protein [Actinomadura sp. CNU-125]OLT30075.1 hypothetical protein BJF79_39690 [Actinomadura sp. CNU-125]